MFSGNLSSRVTRKRRKQATRARRTASQRHLLAEPLESRLMLAGDAWVLPLGIDSYAIKDIRADDFGNSYVAGNVRHDTSTGFYETTWLRKYSPDSQPVWNIDLLDSDNQIVYGVAADNEAVYLAGRFSGFVNLDPLGGTDGQLQTDADSYDGYLAKYSSDGHFQWAKQLSETVGCVSVSNGDVYVVEQYESKKFSSDAIVAKYDESGQLQWSETIAYGWSWNDIALSESEAGPTEIVVSGRNMQFGQGYVAMLTQTTDGTDAAVQWTTEFGSNELPLALAVGAEDAEEMAAYAVRTASDGGQELVKLDGAGGYVWSQSISGYLDRLTLDVEDTTVFLSGAFGDGEVDFDGPGPVAPMTALGSYDAFVARYDTTAGELQVVQQMGGSDSDGWAGMDVADGRLYAVGWYHSPDALYPAALPGTDSAFVPLVDPIHDTLIMNVDVAAPIVEILSPTPNATVDEGTPVMFSGTASEGTVTWYENGQPLVTGNSVQFTLSAGKHQISAIATDGSGRVGMTGVVVNVVSNTNNPPVANDDNYQTQQDEVLNIVAAGVLTNDSDPDEDTITVISATEATLEGGSVVTNVDGSFTYTPPANFVGTDSFTYTITDGDLTDQATVSIVVSEPVTETAIYVYDIRFEFDRGDRDWRAVFEIRSDSNGDGNGDTGDTPIAGVQISVEFAGRTYTGVTDANGVFRTEYVRSLKSGTYYADVVELMMAGYAWDLDIYGEDDSDGDGMPDDVLVR